MCMRSGTFNLTYSLNQVLPYRYPHDLTSVKVKKIVAILKHEFNYNHDKFHLESKFAAFDDLEVCVSFLILHLYYVNIFYCKIKYFTKKVEYIFGNRLSTHVKNELYRIYNIINEHKDINYIIKIDNIHVIWSDIILPELEKYKKVTDVYNYDASQYTNTPELLIMQSNDECLSVIDKALYIYSSKDTVDRISLQDFIYRTYGIAVSVNGVACVGKTTFLLDCIDNIKSVYDQNAQIIKCSNLNGNCKNKKDDIAEALLHQYTMYGALFKYYTSVADRDPFNNYIWRIIMEGFESNRDIRGILYNHLRCLDDDQLDCIGKLPLIFILERDQLANRQRMQLRNRNGDYFRCKIEKYVMLQFVCYLAFGLMVNRINKSILIVYNDELDIAKEYILSKIQHNIANHNNRLPEIKPPSQHKAQYKTSGPSSEIYKTAMKLNIYK